MSAKLRGMRRIQQLRSLQERLAEADATKRNRDRDDAMRWQDGAKSVVAACYEQEHSALLTKDVEGRLLAEQIGAYARRSAVAAERVVVAAVQAADAAHAELRKLRMRTEQVRLVGDHVAGKELYEADRRTQASLDDLIASRRSWRLHRMKDS